jgi:PAS domain S-box-containing protein
MATAPVAAFVKDSDGRYIFANPFLLATMDKWMGPGWRGKTDAEMWPPEAAAMLRRHDQAILRGDGSQVFSYVMKLKDGPHTVLFIEFPVPAGDHGIGVGGLGFDITAHTQADAERSRLGAAIEQVAESVMVADRDARITYVNSTFETVTGYTRQEVIGKNPRILQSGLQTPWFYDAMWAAISNGMPWRGDLVNRRKDGTLYTEEAVISPIREPSGAITSFVAVKRDVSSERAIAERSTQLSRERALISETIRGLRPGASSEVTAQAICRQVLTLSGAKTAAIFIFEVDGRASPIGFVVAGEPDPKVPVLPRERSLYLRTRAVAGPWIEPWISRPGAPNNKLLSSLGIHSRAFAPVRNAQRLIGFLSIAAEASVDEVAAADMLPALVEFADLTGALIGQDMAKRASAGRGRSHILDVIAHRAFRPVFQPIVDLARGVTVGYEALTRFTDGSDPETLFAQAHAVHLGSELELATLQAALAAGESLPDSAWLNVNASPDLIMSGKPLRSVLRGSSRHLVLEVTEHAAITDYSAFRTAMTSLGPDVEFGVDDAGVGFASLRHILELQPAFVKLDRWLVSGLEADEARKAMIVGLAHFARSTGCCLIAEGIETDFELAVLRDLDIQLGQGYLLGRPLPAPDASPSLVADVDADASPGRVAVAV